MINIQDKQQCCGCGACLQKCPKQSISFYEDNEGFLYPHVDTETCIDCGLCEKVCPVLNPYDTCEPLQVLAAINKDEKIRMESSSGGIFTLLAEPIIREGGVVFGARFDEEWQVILDYTESIEGLAAFRGSKYVQARTEGTYKQCEQFLKSGRKVLFTGTPCQIAGLHHYLRNQYDNLITCDCVCHGVPSPKVWRKYLCELSDMTKKAISDVSFRNKDDGWNQFNTSIASNDSANSIVVKQYHRENAYMKAFFMDVILRPSCYACKAKHGSSNSDITIADYWGIQEKHPDMYDNKGTSLVFVNTEKGANTIDWTLTLYKETSYEDAATRYNPGINSITIPHPKRADFFRNLETSKSVIKLINKTTQPPFKRRIKSSIGKHIKSLLVLINKPMGGANKKQLDLLYLNHTIEVDSITFRNKDAGWNNYYFTIIYNFNSSLKI